MPDSHPLRRRLVRTSAVAVLASTLLASTPGGSAVRAVPEARVGPPAPTDRSYETLDRLRRP